MKILSNLKKTANKTDTTSSVHDESTDSNDLNPDEGHAARFGLWALGIGLGVFVLWSAFAPLDEGVPGQGMIALDTKRKTVQHLSGGLIKEILVREGDLVQEGQLLMRLDEAVARANFQAARQRYLGLLAMQGRLQAEQRGLNKIDFHPDVLQASVDPQVRETIQTQQQLFSSRKSALQADLQSIKENIEGQKELIGALANILESRKSQKALLLEEINNTKNLVSEGYVPRNRLLELERSIAESRANIAELTGNNARAKSAIAELQQRAIARQQEYRKDVENILSEVSREVPADAERYRAAQDELKRVEIKSPAAGQVVALAYQTVGGVVGPGQKLMDIVPQDQPLLIEVQVAPHLIDRVNKDLPVDIRFSSFAHTPQLVVHGKVDSVSADILTDQHTGMSYYLARVSVTTEGYKTLGKRLLQPGMPVEVIFITGERSMLTYLISPLTKRMAATMKEE